MAHLPRGWTGKRVAVLFNGEDAGGFEATLVSDNDGGVEMERIEADFTRRLFIPWSAVRYVELMEAPDEQPRRTARVTSF